MYTVHHINESIRTCIMHMCDLLLQTREQVASNKQFISHLVQIKSILQDNLMVSDNHLDQHFQFVKDMLL